MIDGLRPRVDAFESSLPANIQLHRGFDQSETVTHRLGNLARDFAIATVLLTRNLCPR